VNVGRRRFDRAVRITAALWCVLAIAFVGTGTVTPIRAVLTLVGLTLGTGLAIMGWVTLGDQSLFWSVTLGVGVAVSVLVSLAAVEVGWWRPVGTVMGLLLISAASLLLQMVVRPVAPATTD
jgi:hypothetical protein